MYICTWSCVAKLAADNPGLALVPQVIADRSVDIVDTDLDSPLKTIGPSR